MHDKNRLSLIQSSHSCSQTVEGGSFDDVLRILEDNPFDDEYEYKYYAKYFGLIKVEEDLDEIGDGEWGEPGLTYAYVGSVSAPVPEPGTIFLLGAGILGIIGLGRKKMKK